MTEKKCRTIILTDIPITHDMYGEAHKRVASAILDLIITEDEGGKTIGLEGKWGSGKSTIINLLKLNLQDNHITTLVFDTWAHEGDPLRRVLLTKIIEIFTDEKIIPDDKKDHWKEQIEILARRKTVSNVETTPRLTNLGNIVAVAFLFVPIGLAFLSSGLNKGLELDIVKAISLTLTINWFFVIGLLLTLLPGIMFLLFKTEGDSPGALFSKQFDTTTTTTSYSSPDATSVEFEATFNNLIDLLELHKRKFVLVLDNLDRIEPNEALTVLTTLQTFIQNSLYNNSIQNGYTKLWVVIPFDRVGLQKIWQETNNESSNALSMFDKRFQIIFDVPQFVFSNLRKFFIDRMEEAFPDHLDMDHQNQTIRAYEVFRDFLFEYTKTQKKKAASDESIKNDFFFEAQLAPSPREIKLIINQIGALHRIWQDKIPLDQMTYFVLFNRYYEDLSSHLINSHLPCIRKTLVNQDFIENLAALFFVEDKKISLQLLLRNKIIEYLKSRKPEKLYETYNNHTFGFLAVLESIKAEEEFNLNDLSSAVLTIDSSSILDTNDNIRVLEFLKTFSNALNSFLYISTLTGSIAHNISRLSKLTNDNHLVPNIINTISNYSTSDDQGNYLPHTIEEVSDLVEGLVYFYTNIGIDLPQVTLPVKPEDYHKFCALIYKLDKSELSWNLFASQINEDSIIPHYKKIINKDEVYKELGNAVLVASTTHKDLPWDELVKDIYAKLNQFNSMSTETFGSLVFTFLYLLTLYEQKSNLLDALVNNGHIYHHFYMASNTNNSSVFAQSVCIYSIFLTHLPIKMPPSIALAQRGYQNLAQKLSTDKENELISEFIGLILFFKRLDLLLENQKQYPKFINKCLENIFDIENGFGLFTPEMIIKYWQMLDSVSNLKFSNLLRLRCTEVVDELEKSKLDLNNAGLIIKIIDLYKIDNDKGFAKWITAEFNNVTSEDWRQALENNNTLCQVLLILRKNSKIIFNLDIHFQDAFLYIAEKFLNIDFIPKQPVSDWILLLNTLSPNSRKTLRSKILLLVKERKSAISSRFFEVFGEEISDPDIIFIDNQFVLKVLLPIVDSKNLPGLYWIVKLAEKNHDLFSRLNPIEHIDDFRKRLHLLASENEYAEVTKKIERQMKLLRKTDRKKS